MFHQFNFFLCQSLKSFTLSLLNDSYFFSYEWFMPLAFLLQHPLISQPIPFINEGCPVLTTLPSLVASQRMEFEIMPIKFPLQASLSNLAYSCVGQITCINHAKFFLSCLYDRETPLYYFLVLKKIWKTPLHYHDFSIELLLIKIVGRSWKGHSHCQLCLIRLYFTWKDMLLELTCPYNQQR